MFKITINDIYLALIKFHERNNYDFISFSKDLEHLKKTKEKYKNAFDLEEIKILKVQEIDNSDNEKTVWQKTPWISKEEDKPDYGQWCIGKNENDKFSSKNPPYFTFQAHEQAPEFTHWLPLNN